MNVIVPVSVDISVFVINLSVLASYCKRAPSANDVELTSLNERNLFELVALGTDTDTCLGPAEFVLLIVAVTFANVSLL